VLRTGPQIALSRRWDEDEDPITMGVEAARDALAGTERASIGSLFLASTTPPFANRLNAGLVKEALNLPDEVAAMDVSGGQRAGTSSLIGAVKAAAYGGRPQISIAADLRKARAAPKFELAFGDAAAALIVGKGELVALFIGAHSTTLDFADHFRASGQPFDFA
jgi:hydroxymethylglutaryl-CoA synthase